MTHRLLKLGYLILLLAGMRSPLRAQDTFSLAGVHETFVGSESEDYLRVLQVAGVVPLHPWSIRSFSAVELDHLSGAARPHPWMGHFGSAADSAAGPRLYIVHPRVRTVYNSSFPFGSNDGAVWAGRGLTTSIQLGAATRWGAASIVLAPVAFVAQNSAFELAANGEGGAAAFGDPVDPRRIDRPQRFGDEPYVRIDGGQSTARVDLAGVTAGVSTANQHWGPAIDHPLLLGDNAPGFLHGFLGTASPVDLWFGTVHARAVWGRLEQSEYSIVSGRRSRRFMSGVVAVFSPRGVPSLEVGSARFFHTPWPEDGLDGSFLAKPFEGWFKRGRDPNGDGSGGDGSNQLASVFGRWVLPETGLELYGEYAREDHSWDLRDFLVEPDHFSGYMLGLRKLWPEAGGEHITSLRAEILNTGISHLRRVRTQNSFYGHSGVRQGHTHRGQVLGSDAAPGGGAAVVALDRYSPEGRWQLRWVRETRGTIWDLTEDRRKTEERDLDVLHALGADVLVRRGRWEFVAGAAGAYEFQRFFERDAWNLSGVLSVRVGL